MNRGQIVAWRDDARAGLAHAERERARVPAADGHGIRYASLTVAEAQRDVRAAEAALQAFDGGNA